MQTVIMGAEAIAAGSVDYVIAGGMESMTNAPYILKKHRSGARIGHDTAYDHMFLDGLEDAYEPGRAMGTFAQETADEYQLTREAQDDYSIESLRRAQEAIADRRIQVRNRPGDCGQPRRRNRCRYRRSPRQGPPRQNPDAEARLCQGRHDHRGDISSISDGAAAVVLSRAIDRRRQWTERRSRVSLRTRAHAQEPAGFHHRPGWRNQQMPRQGRLDASTMLTCSKSTKPLPALRCSRCATLASRMRRSTSMAAQPLWAIPSAHRARASLTTLIGALKHKGLKRGVAILCIGGGEATAVAVEIVD